MAFSRSIFTTVSQRLICFQLILLVILGGAAMPGFAQTSPTDTLALANESVAQKHFDHAASLLTIYCESHPREFNAIWLYGQIEYWRNNFEHSIELYEKAMQLQPSNAYLQLDYARELISIGHYSRAQELLEKLVHYDVTREAAMLELARSYYWQKENLKAKSEAEALIAVNPKNEAAKKMLNDIRFSMAPWAFLSGGYAKDTQPLQAFLPIIETGTNLSRLLAPYAGFYLPTFFYGQNISAATMFTVGNQFTLGKGPTVKLEGGVVRFPFESRQVFIGKILASQKLSKYLTLDLGYEKKPYFNTLASVDTSITVNRFYSSLEFSKQNGMLGKVVFENNHFFDGNNVYSIYGYFLLKPIMVFGSPLRIGYSYAFNNSLENRFVPKDPLSTILTEGYPIRGVYHPYFTPQQQSINSIVGSLLVPVKKKLKFGLNANVSFYATTYNPYFYLVKKGNTYSIVKEYASIKYVPWDISSYLQWQPSTTWTIRVDYQHMSTFFFISNYVGISVRTIMFHARE